MMLPDAFGNIVNHDVKLYIKKGGDLSYIIGFSLIAISLFPLAFGAQNTLIQTYAPALIWLVALLASLMSLPHIFGRDHADGSLDQLRLSGVTLEWIVLAKSCANWAACQLPLVLVSPFLAMMLGLGEDQAARMMASMAIGTPILTLVGTLGAALTINSGRQSGVLSVLVLPLYIPTLIFASILAMSNPTESIFAMDETYLLLGLLLGFIPLSCWAGAWLLKLQD